MTDPRTKTVVDRDKGDRLKALQSRRRLKESRHVVHGGRESGHPGRRNPPNALEEETVWHDAQEKEKRAKLPRKEKAGGTP